MKDRIRKLKEKIEVKIAHSEPSNFQAITLIFLPEDWDRDIWNTEEQSEQEGKNLPRPVITTKTTAVMDDRAKKIHWKSIPCTPKELAKLQENSFIKCCANESPVVLALGLFVQSPQSKCQTSLEFVWSGLFA